MTWVDLAIVAAILISMFVGFLRGFVKEAISVASLVIAVWAAFNLGPIGQSLVSGLVDSRGLQIWLGRALVFVVVLALGGVIGWAVSYLIEKSGLSGTDRVLGMGFGLCRGALLIGVLVIAGQYLQFSEDPWWRESRLMPYADRVADAIKVIAPRAMDYIKVPEEAETADAGAAG